MKTTKFTCDNCHKRTIEGINHTKTWQLASRNGWIKGKTQNKHYCPICAPLYHMGKITED